MLRASSAHPIQKTATGIDGLDDILQGGFPTGRTTLLSGGPGTGKSVLGLEFIYRGAVAGNPGIYLTFEETEESIRENALSFGWDLSSLEQAGKLFLTKGRIEPETLVSGDFNLKGLLAIIEGKAGQLGAKRIMIDAVDMLVRVFDDPRRREGEILALNNWLGQKRFTSVLTAKNRKDTDSSLSSDHLDFMADCVLYLDQRVREQVTTKRLQVIKYRGSGYGANEYPFFVTGNGVHFNPISELHMRHRPDSQRISSGNTYLDGLLRGGYQTGTCIMITGVTGTGKTSLACTCVRAACDSGQKALYVSYEEAPKSLVQGMQSLGIDLGPAVEESRLRIMSVMPEATGIEEQLFHIATAVKRFQPQHLVLDAVSAVKRIAGERAAFDFLLRLIDLCKKVGITVFLINQSRGWRDKQEISGIGVSSLIDSVLTLRFREADGEIRRELLVLKSRASNHSNRYHEFVLTDRGIRFAEGTIEGQQEHMM